MIQECPPYLLQFLRHTAHQEHTLHLVQKMYKICQVADLKTGWSSKCTTDSIPWTELLSYVCPFLFVECPSQIWMCCFRSSLPCLKFLSNLVMLLGPYSDTKKLLRRMVCNARHCGYARLLHRHCPLPFQFWPSEAVQHGLAAEIPSMPKQQVLLPSLSLLIICLTLTTCCF